MRFLVKKPLSFANESHSHFMLKKKGLDKPLNPCAGSQVASLFCFFPEAHCVNKTVQVFSGVACLKRRGRHIVPASHNIGVQVQGVVDAHRVNLSVGYGEGLERQQCSEPLLLLASFDTRALCVGL
jgi:hypothetical protein